MALEALQAQLEVIYRIELPHRVDDFLITDAELADHLDTSANPRSAKEKLLVQQQGDDLNITLYVAPDVIETLGSDDPTGMLRAENLAAFLKNPDSFALGTYMQVIVEDDEITKTLVRFLEFLDNTF